MSPLTHQSELRAQLPVLSARVTGIVAKKSQWTDRELSELTVQFGPVSFTYRDVVAFSEIFFLVDADASGSISAAEVGHLMALLGEDIDLSEVNAMVAEFDLDRSGEVDLTEFICLMASQRQSLTDYHKKDVTRAFDIFAKRQPHGRPGIINKVTLQQALVQCGRSVTAPKDIAKLVESMPVIDGTDGDIDYMRHIKRFCG